jgi:hypothetical protein
MIATLRQVYGADGLADELEKGARSAPKKPGKRASPAKK